MQASDTLLVAKCEWSWCLQAEGKSPATLAVYGSAVEGLAAHVGDMQLDEVTPRHVRAYRGHLCYLASVASRRLDR
jgi:hypothetical protein